MDITTAPSPTPSSAETPTAPVVNGAPAEAEPNGGNPKDEKDFTKHFNALSKRERELQKREKAFKEQRASFSEDQKRYSDYQKLAEAGKVNPLGILEHMGWTFEQLVDWRLNNGQPTTEQRIEELNSRLTAKEQAEKKAQEDAEAARKTREEQDASERHEKAVNHAYKLIKEHVDNNIDSCELINTTGSHDLIFEVMENYFNATEEETGKGIVMPIADAAAEVEKYLEKQMESVLSTKKAVKRFTPTNETPSGQTTPKPRSPDTLTNARTVTPPGPAPETSMLSDEESKAKIAEWLREEFKRKA